MKAATICAMLPHCDVICLSEFPFNVILRRIGDRWAVVDLVKIYELIKDVKVIAVDHIHDETIFIFEG